MVLSPEDELIAVTDADPEEDFGPMTQALQSPPIVGEAWVLCRACHALVYCRRLDRSLQVCPECGHHGRMQAPQRLAQLLDPGSISVLDAPAVVVDPLSFVDSVPYPRRLEEARNRTGQDEAVRCAAGTIDGFPVVVAVMDFGFLGGSLGSVVGERITRAAEVSLQRRIPLVIVTASGGARMQEGPVSLMQMAMTCQALQVLDEAGVLTVSVVTDPTYGGVAASFATACDVVIGEPGARLGFAGPRVIEQTIRQQLPEGFQTSEFLLKHGLIDAIRPRGALRPTLARLLACAAARTDTEGVDSADAVLVCDPAELPHRSAWDAVQRARAVGRTTSLDLVDRLLDDFVELRGDRMSGDCPAIIGGLGRLHGIPVVVVGQQKGRSYSELINRNFGMAAPAGYRKAGRLMRLANKLGLPIVTLIDTPGAFPGASAEEQGQAMAISDNLRLMAGLRVPVVSVVIGEGGSGGALGLAVADRVLVRADAVYSVISPEGCAAILWGDGAKAPAAADALGLDAASLLRLGVVDGVIRDPEAADEPSHADVAQAVGQAVLQQLRELLSLAPDELVSKRRKRFRRFGAPSLMSTVQVSEGSR